MITEELKGNPEITEEDPILAANKKFARSIIDRVMDGSLPMDSAANILGHSLTSRQKAVEVTSARAKIDSLTNLSNKEEFETRYSQIVEAKVPFGLLAMDLDNFKLINDKYGHYGGDEVIRQIGHRLARATRHEEVIENDSGRNAKNQKRRMSDCIARWGGDEFFALLPGIGDPQALDSIAQRLIGILQGNDVTIDVEGNSFNIPVGISVGGGVFLPNLDWDGKKFKSIVDKGALTDAKETKGKAVIYNAEKIQEKMQQVPINGNESAELQNYDYTASK